MGLEWLLIPTSLLLLGYETRDLTQGGLQIHVEAVATFLPIFRAHMNILSIFKVKSTCSLACVGIMWSSHWTGCYWSQGIHRKVRESGQSHYRVHVTFGTIGQPHF